MRIRSTMCSASLAGMPESIQWWWPTKYCVSTTSVSPSQRPIDSPLKLRHDDVGIGVWPAVQVDDAQAVHELADHVDRRRELHHRDRPDARHDHRQARRPALADVVAVDLAFLLRLLRRVVVHLRVAA